MANRFEAVYPQPIAFSYGRVLRAGSDIERLDQILRCAEVITRYAAAGCIASFAARDDASIAPPQAFQEFDGNLSFGHFLSVVQATPKLKVKHPLLFILSKCFLGKSNPTMGYLEAILKLRNDLGHDLQGLSQAHAKSILATHRPARLLDDVLAAIEPLCSLPLFLVEKQFPRQRISFIRRLILMGTGEPMPSEIAVTDFFKEDNLLYIGTPEGALTLHPMVLWDLERNRATKGVYVIHRINEELEYRSLIQREQPFNPPNVTSMRRLTSGDIVPLEEVELDDGRSFREEWQERLEALTTSLEGETRTVSWTEYDRDTIQWYATLLKRRTQSEIENPHQLLREALLDGRGEVTEDEDRQLRLLFGTDEGIRRLFGRDIVDLRARMSLESSRWDERWELSSNVLASLRSAVDFISKYHPILSAGSFDDLQPTTGSADYLAVREALVNLIIHQDYSDRRTIAQIELEPDRTTMVNAGYSLATTEELRDGGTSTARNPIIARALKLIGFAELGGSGLREMYRVWRSANRRPILVASDDQNNRFRIILDSRPLEIVSDSLWKEKLGAVVSAAEARILSLLGATPEGLSLDEICAGTGERSRDAEQMCSRLVNQQLVDDIDGRLRLKGYLVELAQKSLGD